MKECRGPHRQALLIRFVESMIIEENPAANVLETVPERENSIKILQSLVNRHADVHLLVGLSFAFTTLLDLRPSVISEQTLASFPMTLKKLDKLLPLKLNISLKKAQMAKSETPFLLGKTILKLHSSVGVPLVDMYCLFFYIVNRSLRGLISRRSIQKK